MSGREVLVGVDKGTSTIKAVAVDVATGRLLAQSGARTPSSCPLPGRHEEDMEGTWRATAAALREVVAGLEPGDQVRGVGVTGHMGGMWPVDEDGQPVGVAVCWPDARATEELEEVLAQHAARLFEIGGNVLIPGQPYPLLRWLKTHRPETYERIAHVLMAKDWINLRLTGQLATEESDLSFWPGDIVRRRASHELFDRFGIPEASTMVPRVARSLDLLGAVTPEAAAETGLPVGTPVVSGCGDATANSIGVGARHDGDATTTLGTSLMNGVLASEPVLEPRGVGFSFLQPDGAWQRQITNSGGGTMCLDWVVDRFHPARAADPAAPLGPVVAEAFDTTAPGNRGLLFHPYLNTAGATAPFVDVRARGSFVGLGPEAGPADLVRAVLEGTALAIRDCYEAMPVPVREIRLTGGGARSPQWSQVVADVLQTEIVVPDVPESGALGVAMLAGVATGCFTDLGEAATALVADGRTHVPDPALAEVYDEAFGAYRRLLGPLRDVWAEAAQQRARSERSTDPDGALA